MANGSVHDDIAADYLAQYDRPITVSAMQKLRRWPFLQELGYNGQISYVKKDFHGMKDFIKEMSAYSNTSLLLKAAWLVIQQLVGKNLEIGKLLFSAPGLGSVGQLFKSVSNFGQVFSVSPDELRDPKQLSNKVQSVASGLGLG